MQSVFEKLELVSDVPYSVLDDPAQRKLYKQKLRHEISNFKHRQQLYDAKRSELIMLEQQYR